MTPRKGPTARGVAARNGPTRNGATRNGATRNGATRNGATPVTADVAHEADRGDAIGPEADLVAGMDPLSFSRSLAEAAAALARQPSDLLAAVFRWSRQVTQANFAALATGLGVPSAGAAAPAPSDHRFDDAAWRDNAAFFLLEQIYLINAQTARELVDVAAIDAKTRSKAAFMANMIIDALAPTNLLVTNPTALHKAFQTGGLSVLRGGRNFLQDAATNGGKPRQVDASSFELGRNMAATPGKVVYRSDLMELIQYEPQTDTVFQTPLLASPPWINKYYIMDLAPRRSFIEWAVTHGHTTFAISYRNPDASMRDVSLDDYLLGGPMAALDVMADITGTDQANIVALCLGGTLVTMMLAWLAQDGNQRVRSATLLNTLIDFSEPGVLGAFTDKASIERLIHKMAERGYLEGNEMSGTFDFLRANDLVWNYVANNWLMGQKPPAFDILAWNEDSTRMPAAMHSFYLRSCYLDNALAKGELKLGGRLLHLDDIATDTYLLAAKEDHIAPWRSSYRATQLLKTDLRFVLSSAGHIAGIVNPPGPKARHWVNPELPPEPEAWLAAADSRAGSWWEDWTAWIEPRAGDRRPPPPMGSKAHPALADAPGTYVLKK
jgi:polyhydroxyalkanoate synthase subunit PhaC